MSELPELFPGFDSRVIPTPGGAMFARIGGAGPPLILLHGYPQTHVMWHRLAPALARHFTLVLPDLRGYGSSAAPAGDGDHRAYSKRVMAEDVITIADALGLGRFTLAGHDRGGRVAYRLALDHPRSLTRLALLDIVPTYDMWHGLTPALAIKTFHWTFMAQAAPWPEEMIGRDPLHWMHNKLSLWGGSGDLSIFDTRALAHYAAFFSQPARIHATCEDYRAGAGCDLADDAADRAAGRRIACPTLVLWGAKGIPSVTDGPLAIWRAWCDDVSGQAIDSGHFLAEENPHDTAQALLAFLTPS